MSQTYFPTWVVQGALRVALPYDPGFQINPLRASASRVAVDGSLIEQYSELQLSQGDLQYSGDLTDDDAAILATMRATSAAVTLFHLDVRYSATCSIVLLASTRALHKLAQIRFRLLAIET